MSILRKIKTLITRGFGLVILLPDVVRFVHRNRSATSRRFSMRLRDLHPQPFDNTPKTRFDRHYVYHTAWAVRQVSALQPNKHVDIASSLYFSALLSAHIPVDFYDFRPADLELDGLQTRAADLTKLPFADNSIISLSCMHTIEHIGLGRYGDPIDPDADLQACQELGRVLAPKGQLLVVVPVGRIPRIHFNAHRVYDKATIVAAFSGLDLVEFSLVPEVSGGMLTGAAAEEALRHERYAAGCFVFTKPTKSI